MPSLWDFQCKRPEGPKYISPRCQPWVGSELSKVPEAQDVFIDESAFASGMKTDGQFFASIISAQPPSSFLALGHADL